MNPMGNGEQRRIVTYLDGLQAKVNALRELQSAMEGELSTMLLPSVPDGKTCQFIYRGYGLTEEAIKIMEGRLWKKLTMKVILLREQKR